MAQWIRGGLLAVWAAGAGVAEAGELVVGADIKAGYDSNVFARESGPDDLDSGVFVLSAFGEVKDSLEKGSYKVSYKPTYFINEADRADNTWNHEARAEGVYNFSPRTSVTLSHEFSFFEKLTFTPSNEVINPNFDDQARRTLRDSSTLSFSHLLTRRLSTFANSTYTLFRYSRSEDEDNEHLSGSAGLNYAISDRLRVGGGGSVRYSSFDSEQNSRAFCVGDDPAGSRSFSYSGFVSGSYQFDRTTHMRVQAGPAKIESTSFLCSLVLGVPAQQFQKERRSQITWFAQGELSKRWERTKISASYRRSEGLGGVGTSTINDSVTANFTWQPARYWDFGLQGGWIQRAQDRPQNANGIKTNLDTTTWTASARLSRQILKRLRVSVTGQYRNQGDDQSCSGPAVLCSQLADPDRDFDAWLVLFGLTYRIDPIRF